jgi:transglutaminase-like putative cysteine protease
VSTRSRSFDVGSLGLDPGRVLALGAAGVLTFAYASVLYRVSDVVGVSGRFALVFGGAVLAGVLCGRYLGPRVALVLGGWLLGLGGLWYARSIPEGFALLVSVNRFAADVVALLTGLSVLQVVNAGVWAIAFVPAPTFLLWYFAIGRRYALATLSGGSALGLFVLTGDAGAPLTLLGMVGAVGLVGFGDLERRGGGLRGAESVATVLAAMIVVSLLVSVVPGGASDPIVPGGSSGETLEANLLNAGERVQVLGGISLSPEVRFSVRSEQPAYWRVGAYDRYTGSDWYRTGGIRQFDGSLAEPPGETRAIEQTYRLETELGVMPAAWQPTDIEGPLTDRTRVTSTRALRPADALAEGESYTVRSEVPQASAADLRTAGREYPGPIGERYTQLPASTPERVGQFTTQLTANAESPYQTARVIERWLENNKEYSLDVERPEGDVTDGFLFEMDRGYCVYYATAMTTMLRSQGVPARFVVGYTPGEQVSEEEWVVRGFDSHAWVEVYFPGEGWVRFDPTPAGPRRSAEQQSLEDARAASEPNVDTEGTNVTETPTPSPSSTENDGSGENESPESTTPEEPTENVAGGDPGGDVGGASAGEEGTPAGVSGVAESGAGPSAGTGANGSANGSTGESGGVPSLPTPSREGLLLGVIVLGRVLASVHRSDISRQVYRALWLRRQRSRDPVSDVEGAFARLEYLLAREHRNRRPGETPRKYLAAIDAGERARRVGAIYARARYAGGVSEAEATEATEIVGDLVAERSRLPSVFG